MPRHVDPDDHSFRRSLLRAALGGLAALLVTFGITGVLTQLGRANDEQGPAVTFTGAPSAPVTAVEQTPAPEPTAAADSEAAVEPTPQPTSEPAPVKSDDRDTGTVTVQVLDAVGSGTFAQDAAAALRELGYEVVVVNTTPRRVTQTRVLYTDGHEQDAQDLRDADERFADIRENRDFSPSVNLHVLVGPDFTN